MSILMTTELEELHKRVEKIERQKNQEILTLVEILSNATFFGEIKKANCEYSKNGQCSFFTLEAETKNKIPIATDCRIKQCKNSHHHCHIEVSNITCALCQNTNSGPIISSSKNKSKNQSYQNTKKFNQRLNKKGN
jgi:hypothetical protein